MAIIKGNVSGSKLEIDAATLAARTQLRPTDVGTLGSYQIDTVSGIMAAGLAGASPIYSCRWGDATRAMVVHRIALAAWCLGTAFAAGNFNFDVVVARGFTSSDTGGASILPTGNSQKKRTSFGTTLITDLRQSATATLAAVARTLDAQPVASVKGFVPATTVNYPIVGDMSSPVVATASTVVWGIAPKNLVSQEVAADWPLVFVQNEGFIIRTTVPGTGTWSFSVQMEWSEVVTTAGFN